MSTQQAVLVGVAAYLAYRVWRAASEKARTDTLPVVHAFRAMFEKLRLAGQPFNTVSQKLSADTLKRGAYWLNFGGVSNFVAADADLAQQVFTKVDTFTKIKFSELKPDTLIARMFGGSNVVFTNGDDWKRHRKVVSPPFHKALPLHSFVQVTETLLKKFETMDTTHIDVNVWAQKITLDALGLAAFGYNFDSLNKENDEQVIRYNYIMRNGSNPLFVFFPWIEKIPFNPVSARLYRELDIFDKFLLSIITNKRAALKEKKSQTPDDEKDLLELMLEANEVDNTLTDDELRENAFIFFVAGHDTTSSTIASLLYNLATHQDKQDKVRAEIEAVFAGKDASTITLEQQKQLVYMTGCIKETLRLYPPVQLLPQRKLAQEIDLDVGGGETVHLVPGDVAMVSIFAIHHDEKHWEKPYEFMPERFLSDVKRHPYAWIPFGAGTRMCLGLNFSLVEQRVVLSILLQKYRVTLPENSQHKDGLILETQGLAAPKDLHLCFERI